MRIRLTLLFAAVLWLVLILSASAHAKVVAETPSDGASVATAPSQVTVKFSEDVDPNGTTVTVKGPSGQTVSDQKTTISVSSPTVATVAITPTGNGTYTVNWHAVADDDKGVTEGTFKFTIGPATAGANQAATTANSGSSLSSYLLPAVIVVVVVALLAFAGLRLRSTRQG